MLISEATTIVNKNFNRVYFCSDYLQKANLYVLVLEKSLYKKIMSIYRAKQRELLNAKL